MRIEAHPHALEIDITEITGPGLPRPGDLRLQFQASISGFFGAGWCWVAAEDFEAFAAAVQSLYSSFQGEAALHSISPEQFSLRLSPASPRGYVLVNVAMRKWQPVPCSMSGAFEIELNALGPVIAWAKGPRVG